MLPYSEDLQKFQDHTYGKGGLLPLGPCEEGVAPHPFYYY